ncbi:GP46-like surface antigen, putative, partial [Bodo saltans]
MRRERGAAVLLLCILLCRCCYLANGAALQLEVDIIAQFFKASGFRNTTAVTTENLCSGWPEMISCGSNRVASLNFKNTKLVGTLPTGFSRLIFLSSLIVSENQLTGSIPPDLGRCSNMMNVQMAKNLLSGSLPPELSNCSFMSSFNVSNNNISGTIPAAYSAWGTSIVTFEASANNLTGILPPEFASWKSLNLFAVADNQLFGTLPPEYSSMKAVTYFRVNKNFLAGSIPDAYHQLRGAITFSCSNNFMIGTLPSSLAAWTKMNNFQVDGNRFTGSLPLEYANWTEIVYFYVNNNFLSGTLPPQYGNGWNSIAVVSAHYNSITGSLPTEYSALTALTSFSVASNLITGTLPPQYAAWLQISQLNLNGNGLTGPIPTSWGTGMISLRTFSAFNNMLSGTIPLIRFPLLTAFAISFNDFSGSLPTSASWPTLTILDVQNNSKLVGPITLPAATLMISSCGTQLCISRPETLLAQACFPSGGIAATLNLDLAAFLAFASANLYSTVSCAVTTVAPPSMSPIHSPPINSSNPTDSPTKLVHLPSSVQSATASAVYATTVMGGAGSLGRGAVPALQRALASLRLAARCNAAMNIANNSAVDGGLMFSDLADNPLSVLLPVGAVDLSAAGGAAVMNAVLVVVIGAALHASALLQRRLRSHGRAEFNNKESSSVTSNVTSVVISLLPASRVPGSLAVPFGALMQPGVGACVALMMSSARTPSSVVCGVIMAMVWMLLPVYCMFAVIARGRRVYGDSRFALRNIAADGWIRSNQRKTSRRPSSVVARVLSAVQQAHRYSTHEASRWTLRTAVEIRAVGHHQLSVKQDQLSNRKYAAYLLENMEAVFGGYVGGREWYFAV